jgi:predicted ATPase/class 3 adenylate cyclase
MYAFLFTDIAESTRLWELHPEAMGPALARHDRLLRDAVEGAEGQVVKTTGDGLHAVFDDAASAVAAALAGQLAIGDETWDDEAPIRVRMGVHMGEAEPRAGDFYGSAVNRAARIMAAAHGGQVLVSSAVANAASGHLPAGVGLRDLGEHRLRDLSEPQHVYQLTHDRLPSDFPSLLTLTGRPNNLPMQASEFLGRETELAGIRSVFDEGARLVTLTGPGGTGKTRLGLQAAASLIDRFDDGVFFVDLSHEEGRASVIEAILRALGAPSGDEGPMAALIEHLRGLRLLLVLDNFEHVTEAAPEVAEILGAANGLAVLVTSREALRVRGERLFPVAPMKVPVMGGGPVTVERVAGVEAVSLFVERAAAVQPGFSLTDENAGAVAEICVRLDGLPLAIELAAARLTLFTPQELRDRLSDRLDVLGVGARDLPERQRTIRNTIEWSVELLGDDEEKVFLALSAFATARMESVEDVARRLEPLRAVDVVGALASLVDKSLVRSTHLEGRLRLSMLRTIRDYAAERLVERDEMAQGVYRAHAEHYSELAATLCESLFGPQRAATLDEVEAEVGNLALAWQHWRALGDRDRLRGLLDCLWPFHDARGSYAATIGLTSDLLELVTELEPSPERLLEEVALRSSLARALIAVHGVTTRRVEEAVNQAVDLFTEASGAHDRFAVLRNLATLFGQRSEFTRALEIGRELVALADEADDDTLRSEAHFVLGAYLAFTGSIDEGLEHLDRGAAVFDPERHATEGFRVGPISGVLAYTTRGFLLWWAGRPVRAMAVMDEALALARRLGHPYTLAYVLYHAGFFDLGRRDLTTIGERAAELGAVAEAHGYEVWRALAMLLEGIGMVGSGSHDRGLARIEEAIGAYEVLDTPPVFWGYLQSARAVAFGMAGRPTDGLPYIEEAVSASGHDTPDFASAATVKGELLLAAGDAAGAEECFRMAVAAAAGAGVAMLELVAATRLVRVRRELGMIPDGIEELARAHASFEEGFDLPQLREAAELLDGA